MQSDNPITIWRRIPSQNVRDRWHWRTRHQDLQVWLSELRYCISGTYQAPSEARSLTITSYRSRLILDHANLVGGSKGLVDAIVHAGLINDDADAWASIRYEQAQCKRVDERTEIIIDGFEPLTPLRCKPKPIIRPKVKSKRGRQ